MRAEPPAELQLRRPFHHPKPNKDADSSWFSASRYDLAASIDILPG
jgi:hypothetical protein